jgi:hypothetical protein
MSTNTISIDEEIQLKPETIAARAKIEQIVAMKGITPFTFEELRSSNAEQTPEEITAEVDDFLRLLYECRNEPYSRSFE